MINFTLDIVRTFGSLGSYRPSYATRLRPFVLHKDASSTLIANEVVLFNVSASHDLLVAILPMLWRLLITVVVWGHLGTGFLHKEAIWSALKSSYDQLVPILKALVQMINLRITCCKW